jgi:hypothetical protein
VNNKVYLAGCRALGIIDKLMTGPLWKQIENAKHILDLNSKTAAAMENKMFIRCP